MCIGIPMQVREVAPGRALTEGRGQSRWISTLLVGPVQPGDWVLMFLDSAREVITPQRATEVNAVLDLVEASMGAHAHAPGHGCAHDHDHVAAATGLDAFVLPSQMSAQELQRLTGS